MRAGVIEYMQHKEMRWTVKRSVSAIITLVLIWIYGAGTDIFASAQGGSRCVIKGAALSLAGDIGVEFFIDVQSLSQAESFELDGPNGKSKVSADSLEVIENGDRKGLYRLCYPVDPTQCEEKITLTAIGKGGICELYRSDEKTRFDGDKAVYSVRDYIDAVKADGSARKALKALVSALDVYSQYARAYFRGGEVGLDAQLPNITAADISKYRCTVHGDLPQNVKIKGAALVLDSETTFRIYFDGAPKSAYVNGQDADVKSGEKGCYIELSGIGANKLSSSCSASADGCEITFSALSYVYGVLESEPDQSKPINKLARALYAYSAAADNYAAMLADGSMIDSIEIKDADGQGTDYTFSYGGEQFTAKFSYRYDGKENWRINGSYRVRSRMDMILICQALLDIHKIRGRDLVSWRSAQDMADEWQLHNLAYDYLPQGQNKQRAGDVDFDPDDQYKTLADFIQQIMNGG